MRTAAVKAFLGHFNEQHKRVTVVGAGISGLLCSYYLKKRGYQVTLYEASPKTGGLIQDKPCPYGLVETAAHSLMASEPVLELFRELQLEFCEVDPQSKARYIYRFNQLKRWPLTFFETLQTLKAIISKPKQSSLPSMTLHDWGLRYLGRAATDILLSPFVSGIYACASKELDAQLAFPKWVSKDLNQSLFSHLKSIPKNKGKAVLKVPKNGMFSLVNALQENLKNELTTQRHFTGDDLKNFPFDEQNLVLTIPTHALSTLTANHDQKISTLAAQVQYSPLITCTVFFNPLAFKKIPQGVGVLIPHSASSLKTLGVLFNSSAFPQRQSKNSTHANPFKALSFTFMLGGTQDPKALELSDQEIKTLIHKEAQILLTATEPPVEVVITRWERAIPVYNSNLRSLIQALNENKDFATFANYTGQVSIRGMVESLTTGLKTV